MALGFVRSLAFFTKDVIFYDMPIFSIAGSILLVIGGILAY